MNERKVPYKRMIFVCTNEREGEAACGNAERGESCGLKLLEMLREEVKARGLKKRIRIAKSGCMDLCALGPSVMVFDEKGEYSFLSRVSKDDVPQIVQKEIASLETPAPPTNPSA